MSKFFVDLQRDGEWKQCSEADTIDGAMVLFELGADRTGIRVREGSGNVVASSEHGRKRYHTADATMAGVVAAAMFS